MEMLAAIACIIMGGFTFFHPEGVIEFKEMFKFKDGVEPSDWYIKSTKYGGLFMALLGAFYIILSFTI